MFRRIVLFILLCCLSTIFLAEILFTISRSNPLIFSQSTTPQLIQQGEQDYRSGDFEQAGAVWQELVERFSESGDSLNQAMALSNLSLVKQKLGPVG